MHEKGWKNAVSIDGRKTCQTTTKKRKKKTVLNILARNGQKKWLSYEERIIAFNRVRDDGR